MGSRQFTALELKNNSSSSSRNEGSNRGPGVDHSFASSPQVQPPHDLLNPSSISVDPLSDPTRTVIGVNDRQSVSTAYSIAIPAFIVGERLHRTGHKQYLINLMNSLASKNSWEHAHYYDSNPINYKLLTDDWQTRRAAYMKNKSKKRKK